MTDAPDLIPAAYFYKYANPITGKPVWRRTCEQWNGQRPTDTKPLYSADTIDRLIAERDEARAEVERLREALQVSRLNGAWDDHPDCEEIDELIARADGADK